MNEESNNVNETIATDEVVETNTVEQPQEKTFNQSELDKILEKRLERENRKWEEKFNALQETQKLAQMSEEQKQEYSYTKKLEELQLKEKELNDKLQAYQQTQYKAEIQKQLSEHGLPDVSDLLVSMDAESVNKHIQTIKDQFNAQLNFQLEQRVKASAATPIKPNEQAKLLSLDEIRSMSPQEVSSNKKLIEESLKALRK